MSTARAYREYRPFFEAFAARAIASTPMTPRLLNVGSSLLWSCSVLEERLCLSSDGVDGGVGFVSSEEGRSFTASRSDMVRTRVWKAAMSREETEEEDGLKEERSEEKREREGKKMKRSDSRAKGKISSDCPNQSLITRRVHAGEARPTLDRPTSERTVKNKPGVKGNPLLFFASFRRDERRKP